MKRDGHECSNRSSPTLDASVSRRLHVVATRLRRYVLVEGVAWVLGFAFLSSFVQLIIDFSVRGLRWSMRAAILAAVLSVGGILLWRRVLQPSRLRIGIAEAARFVERRYPELSAVLISAVRFSRGQVGAEDVNSPSLQASVIHRAAEQTRDLDFNVVLDPRRARWSGVVIAGILVLGTGIAVTARDTTALWFARSVLLQNVPWPKRTRLVVDLRDGELVGARGDDLVIQARAEGVQPRTVEIIYETTSGKRGRETMVTVGSHAAHRYRYTVKNAQEDFEFRLEGGDDRTPLFKARLLERPRIDWSSMRVVPPAYARIDPFTLGADERTAEILPGSTATISITTNKPVTRATLMAGSRIVAEAASEGEHYVVTIAPTQSHTYHFALVDEVGLENRKPVSFSLRIIDDEPPHVRLKLPGVGDMITPEAVVPIELEFADTYGLAGVELVYRVSNDEERTGSIALSGFQPHSTTFSTSVNWKVNVEAVQPGHRITLVALASDFDPTTDKGTARSPEVSLRVVTHDELLAEIARREQEYRMDFERLVDGQEQLRGRLLTVAARFADRNAPQELSATLAPLERRQRNLGRSVNVVRQQFEQILTELSINQLDTAATRERLAGGIIGPLTRLAKRELVTAADLLRQWARDASPERAAGIDPQQVTILAEMRSVLARMLQWEGYHEVVDLLRDIIRLQGELNAETRDTLLEDADRIFDD